jgi:hypothetical protein
VDLQPPRLNLGLLGFNSVQRGQVESFLAVQANLIAKYPPKKGGPPGLVPWQITDYREANALLLSTQDASVDRQRTVRFPPDQLHTDVVGVQPAQLRIPYAVVGDTNPAIYAAMAPGTMRVDLAVVQSLQKALSTFEANLHAVRSLFALAQLLLERRNGLDEKRTHHIVRTGILAAIIDMPEQKVMLRNGLQPADLDEADWLSRPASANSIPPGFTVWTMEELAWMYAQHNAVIELPERYAMLPIYLRQLPTVRPWKIYPRQMELLEMLGHQPRTFAQLAALFPQQVDVLKRDLYVLYACRVITSSPARAGLSAVEANLLQESSTQSPFTTTSIQPASEQPFQLATMHAGLN